MCGFRSTGAAANNPEPKIRDEHHFLDIQNVRNPILFRRVEFFSAIRYFVDIR